MEEILTVSEGKEEALVVEGGDQERDGEGMQVVRREIGLSEV